MAKKRVDRGDFSIKWWWVCHRVMDPAGIYRWQSYYNCRSEKEAKQTIRALSLREPNFRKEDWTYHAPGEGSDLKTFDQESAAAKKGICPRCGAKPKHTKQGRSKGFLAFKCGKCDHLWRILGTRVDGYTPPEPPTEPSKALVASKKGSVPKKRSEKPKKGKKKRSKAKD